MRKKLSIALLAFSLAMICANFIVRRVGRFFPPPQQEVEEERGFFPFASVNEDSTENTPTEISGPNDLTVKIRPENVEYIQEDEIRITEKEIVKPVLKLELTEEEKQTIETYSKNPKLSAFIKEISATVSQEELEQGNYLQIVHSPEVRSIFMKYSQDEDFRKIATEVMKDKKMLQLAKKIVNNSEVKK